MGIFCTELQNDFTVPLNIRPYLVSMRLDIAVRGLLKHKNLAIERICSSSEIPQCPYVQTQDEWVLLIQGTAEIEIDGLI